MSLRGAALGLLLALALPVAAAAAPKAQTSIVGGQPAAIADWPSIAYLLAVWDGDGDGVPESGSSCTGTVIQPQWVLTAAHCGMRADTGADVDAILTITGAADNEDQAGEPIVVDRAIVHDAWNPQANRLLGDAMLLHLERPSSRPAMPLAQAGVVYGLKETIPNVAGWGLIDEDATPELGTSLLQEAFITILEDEECEDFDPEYDRSSQTCAYLPGVAGVCRGDSGGPLTVLDQAGVPHLWGVTSYGTQLRNGLAPCSRQAPAVFSWAPAFGDWIAAKTAEVVPPPPPPPPTGGAGQPPPAAAPRDTTPPVLSRARLSRTKVRPARRGATIARRTGAKLSFRLSEAAAVRVSVLKGRKAIGSPVMITAQAGRTTRTFTGRAGAKKLERGRYALRLSATDGGGNAARPVTVRFKIVR